MRKVITYGTYDLLHEGHIRLLERAKALGDYLIVGVTSEDFDKARGKINVQQSLMERVEAVRATGLADEILIEEYDGQKIDDIRRHEVDVFTVGSDWIGKFDYLKEYCEVVYLERTEGISSTEIRSHARTIRLGLVGGSTIVKKIAQESEYVNGISISGIYSDGGVKVRINNIEDFRSFDELLERSDAIYLITHPNRHYEQIKYALTRGIHVLCESPITMRTDEYCELSKLARDRSLILMDSIKTIYSTAFMRLLLQIKSGIIGKVRSVDATCTSLRNNDASAINSGWGSLTSWGPTAMLPIFQILGTNYLASRIVTKQIDEKNAYDIFTKIDFIFRDAIGTIKVANGVKSEGELIISGENGYVYVPAPWWKTDYYEVRFEDVEKNKRFFYQLDGEGIRYMLMIFVKSIAECKNQQYLPEKISESICTIMQEYSEKNYIEII